MISHLFYLDAMRTLYSRNFSSSMRVAPRLQIGPNDARRLLANSQSECVRKGCVYLCGTLGFFCHWRDEGRQMELDVDHSTTYMCYVLRSKFPYYAGRLSTCTYAHTLEHCDLCWEDLIPLHLIRPRYREPSEWRLCTLEMSLAIFRSNSRVSLAYFEP